VTFSLHVDAELWRAGIKAEHDTLTIDDEHGGQVELVPVIASHGWGLHRHQLAREATVLGARTLAVETPADAMEVAADFAGDILVTQPWDPRHAHLESDWDDLTGEVSPAGPEPDRRVIRTIATTDALHRLAESTTTCAPVVLQGLTSRHCIGLQEPDLDALLADDTIRAALRDSRIDIRGALLHLPGRQPGSPQVSTIGDSRGDVLSSRASNRVRESWGWTVLWIRALAAVEQSGIDLHASATTMWVDGLDDSEVSDLQGALDVVPIKLLRGSQLWLPDDDSLQAYGTVLAVHRVERGRDVGDRQRGTPKDGYIVVLRGGTSHGIGVAAGNNTSSLRERASAAAGRAMSAIGRLRSPFVWAGKRRWFVEPPGSSTSLVWLSAEDLSEALASGHRTPAVGDQWACDVNPELARYDRIVGLG